MITLYVFTFSLEANPLASVTLGHQNVILRNKRDRGYSRIWLGRACISKNSKFMVYTYIEPTSVDFVIPNYFLYSYLEYGVLCLSIWTIQIFISFKRISSFVINSN